MSDNTNENEIMVDKFVRWIENLNQEELDFYGAFSDTPFDESVLNLTRGYLMDIGKSKKYEKLLELQPQIKSGLGF